MNAASRVVASLRSSDSARIARLLLLCVAIGALAGLASVAFYWLIEIVTRYGLEALADYRLRSSGGDAANIDGVLVGSPRLWVLLLLPAVGALASGWLCWRYAREAAGPGTDAAIDAYHHHSGHVRGRVPLIKVLAASLTIGSGGSAGREGPIAQIGAGIASKLARWTRASEHEGRILMGAGMAAGVGAMFHAPLAGALFAAEVLYREMDLEHETIVPAFISSIVAYSIFSSAVGWDPIFATPNFVYRDPLQLLLYVALAVGVALVARIFTRLFHRLKRSFAQLALHPALKPALGGLLAGGVGVCMPEALSTGYGVLQSGFDGSHGLGFLALLLVAKMLTTCFTVASGASGGVFGPSVVIGGCTGGILGTLANALFPSLGIDVGAFVVVGMAGFFAAVANWPISTIIMVSEMTGSYALLVPSMLVCILAYLFTRGDRAGDNIYEMQLPTRLEAPSKMGHMLGAVLRTIPVRDALDTSAGELRTLPEVTRLHEIIALYSIEDQPCFPVVDAQGALSGMIVGRDIRRALAEEGVAELVVAGDLARPQETLSIDATLLDAVQKMTYDGLEELILVDAEDEGRAVGLLEHQQILRAYDRKLAEREHEAY